MINNIFLLWSNIITIAMPMWLMGLGLLLCQRVGLLQWGVAGIIVATSAVVYSFLAYGADMFVGLAAAMAMAMVLGGLYFLLLRIMEINELLSGLAVFFLGIGLQRLINNNGVALSQNGDIDFVIYYIAPYLVLLLMVMAGFFLQRMKWGMVIRGMGDEPQALLSIYPIKKIQFIVNMVGMALIGLGVWLLVLVSNGDGFVGSAILDKDKITNSGIGWLLLVAVALSAWSPYRLLFVVAGLATAVVVGDIPIGGAYGLLLVIFVFVLAQKDHFKNHAPKSWRDFFYPIID